MSIGSDSKELRRAFGRFTTGIAIVTGNEGGRAHGMTANSFTPVSQDPPSLLVCIHNDAKMMKVLKEHGHYGLSVLASTQEPISRHFAGCRDPELNIVFETHNGVPLITGALAHFVCKIVDAPSAGDHTIYVGEVEYFRHAEGPPLLFFAGSYQHRLEPHY